MGRIGVRICERLGRQTDAMVKWKVNKEKTFAMAHTALFPSRETASWSSLEQASDGGKASHEDTKTDGAAAIQGIIGGAS